MTRPLDAGPLVDRLFRMQSSRLVAHFTRRFGPAHLDLAEEVVQEALVKALQQWPYTGVPANPAGWLFRVASNEALDAIRRRASFGDRRAEMARAIERERSTRLCDAAEAALADDELRMVLMCCHPSLSRDARVALSLKTVGGLSVPEIARALLSNDRAIAQCLVRAKRRIRALAVPFDLPSGAALAGRVNSALDVIYLLFNEGYGAHGGDNLVRADLSREALRLGRVIAEAPEVATARAHALVSLMAFQAAREAARVDPHGELVRLHEQDRSKWDRTLIGLGFASLERAMTGERESAFHLQAGIAATHAAARDAASTDWRAILELYDALVAMEPSPVVRLNRAIALAKVHGPAAGLTAIAPLSRERSLDAYYLLPAVRADLLAEAGRYEPARRAYREALARPCSSPERRFLEARLMRLSRRAS